MLNPAQTYGVEIECYLPDGVGPVDAAQKITDAGIACRYESYGHSVPTQWKIVTDGSLSAHANGFEIVSPVMFGEGGLEQVRTVCKALTEMGAIVRKTCGLHVHFGARSWNIETFKSLLLAYRTFEPVIGAMLPQSRRDNTYCRELRRVTTPERIAQARTVRDLQYVLGSGRYVTLNLMPFFRQGTVEFRQHSGTVDGEKIVNWIMLCASLIERAKRGAPATVAREFYGSSTSVVVARMVNRPMGATLDEIVDALRQMGRNVQSVAIADICRKLNIELRRTREAHKVRYFAVQQAELPITIEGLATYAELRPDLVAYIRQRTEQFAQRAA